MSMKTGTAGLDWSLNWVDFAVVAALCFGLWRGRKRGMSEEFLDIIKWALIVLGAGFLYEPGGRLLASLAPIFGLGACYVFVYVAVALTIVITCAVIRQGVGAKLVGSDVFGTSEYYLGMFAGAFRYACILVVAMSFLNAIYYSPEEIRASARYQEDNFGSDFFPTLPDMQQAVFKRSFMGRLAHDYLGAVLIQPAGAGGRASGQNGGLGRRREGSFYDMLEKK